jgi:hypothetical protein
MREDELERCVGRGRRKMQSKREQGEGEEAGGRGGIAYHNLH